MLSCIWLPKNRPKQKRIKKVIHIKTLYMIGNTVNFSNNRQSKFNSLDNTVIVYISLLITLWDDSYCTQYQNSFTDTKLCQCQNLKINNNNNIECKSKLVGTRSLPPVDSWSPFKNPPTCLHKFFPSGICNLSV